MTSKLWTKLLAPLVLGLENRATIIPSSAKAMIPHIANLAIAVVLYKIPACQ